MRPPPLPRSSRRGLLLSASAVLRAPRTVGLEATCGEGGADASGPWRADLRRALGFEEQAWELAAAELRQLSATAAEGPAGAIPAELREGVNCTTGRQCVGELFARLHLLLYATGSGSSSQGDDDNKIWLRGFPRKLLAPQFKAHYESKVMPLLHDSIKHNVKPVYHNMSFSYMVVFPSKTHAQQFKDGIASRQLECDWVDPRDNVQHQIRAGAHKPLEIRKRGFVLSQLWRMIKEHLFAHHLWREGVCSLGTNAYKGSLYFSNGIEAWELFKVEEQNSGYRITPMVEDLPQIHMNEAGRQIVDNIIDLEADLLEHGGVIFALCFDPILRSMIEALFGSCRDVGVRHEPRAIRLRAGDANARPGKAEGAPDATPDEQGGRSPEPTELGSPEPTELRSPRQPPGGAESGLGPAEVPSLAPSTPRGSSPEPAGEGGAGPAPAPAPAPPLPPPPLPPALGRVAALRLVYGAGPRPRRGYADANESLGLRIDRAAPEILETARKRLAQEMRRAEADLRDYPVPAFLAAERKRGTVMIAVTGAAGVGKSSLVNALCGFRPKDPVAAETGVVETTCEPLMFRLPGHARILRPLAEEKAEVCIGDRLLLSGAERRLEGTVAEVVSAHSEDTWTVRLEDGTDMVVGLPDLRSAWIRYGDGECGRVLTFGSARGLGTSSGTCVMRSLYIRLSR
ncbi:unnamed protein product [Prorocentrum cordatum]|uniref:IRG-type G domain-containing protein n=1 Tax=Prorocentrum cordatum TaxID=2364126 RepID=A0ABN9WTS1_9DINO|nr:unnamed protein product [Polarella glacialis]